ncbi:hypothetical protein [Massilia pseudoviolaceinigra]|uniref:hypothetical protein n=1 Tax=Massilia pseudoviolaceinigra TaxID=3057165 RepID=UPI00279660F5|nr:hypothetical protein [Massilia sp. CCM 9206]MDQ1924635.1 hypothetical protein [Massilia sp. CCM 9206]
MKEIFLRKNNQIVGADAGNPPGSVSEGMLFARRLNSAAFAAGIHTSATQFARGFNLRSDGLTVTTHGARKWLRGDSIPTQGRIQILADWTGVSAAWLRFGEGDRYAGAPTVLDCKARDAQSVVLVRDFLRLPKESQAVVRGLIDVLLQAAISAQK